MPRAKRIRTTSNVHNEDIEPFGKPNEMEASVTTIEPNDDMDVLRADGEGMVTTDQPSAELPPLPMVELFRARLDAAQRSFTQVQVPAMKRAIIGQVRAHPFATVGIIAAAGALGALLVRPNKSLR